MRLWWSPTAIDWHHFLFSANTVHQRVEDAGQKLDGDVLYPSERGCGTLSNTHTHTLDINKKTLQTRETFFWVILLKIWVQVQSIQNLFPQLWPITCVIHFFFYPKKKKPLKWCVCTIVHNLVKKNNNFDLSWNFNKGVHFIYIHCAHNTNRNNIPAPPDWLHATKCYQVSMFATLELCT